MPIVETLTAAAFAPFGDVVEINDSNRHFPINYGHTERYHDIAAIDVGNAEGRIAVSIFRSNPLPLPITINMLERHPLSSQLFMPLGTHPYLVIVAPPGEFDESAIKLFLATAQQGVNYHAGTWHHFSLALNKSSDFFVVDRVGEGDNCDEVILQNPFTLAAAELGL